MTQSFSAKKMPLYTKADIILAIILVIAGFALSFYLASGKTDGSTVSVRVEGSLYGTYSLAKDQTIDITQGAGRSAHINTLQIKDGIVSVIAADCSGQDCVQHRSISRSGETIVCLPNKVVVEINGESEAYDAITE